jgi:hypothetical protein
MTANPSEIAARIRNAVAAAGRDPWLVGYDANGIQELITASGRLISMRGASEAILGFDKEVRERRRTIFAGGGRGVVLATSREDAVRQERQLIDDYRRVTGGGVMASCAVPLQRGGVAEAQSIRWLRHRLEIAKDAAQPPGGKLPSGKEDECTYCRRYCAERVRTRDGMPEMVCQQCDVMLGHGRKTGRSAGERVGEMSLSIADIATGGWIAATSADGNNLGRMFESLRSLDELAVVSEAVAACFKDAQERALETICEDKRLSLVTGGDDVRAFLRPRDVLGYVDRLARNVESEAASHARAARGLISSNTEEALGKLGVGVGAVIANVYYPAWRLVEHAHRLEISAKTACRKRDWRSGFDFAIVTTEDAMTEAPPGALDRGDVLPLKLCTDQLHVAQRHASALLRIPSAQLAILANAPAGPEEIANLLRYQVARSQAWRDWYTECDVDWRDAEKVFQRRPTRGALELAKLLGFARTAEPEACP